MPSDAARPGCRAGGSPQQQHPPEALPCPRCDSINTKFCYYNNYNLSQPRHFCKSCRRYWTQGGTLRNVPVGGGSRKLSTSSSSKRLRNSAASAPSATSSPPSTSSSLTSEPIHSPAFKSPGELPGAYTSLLTSQAGAGFLALGGGFGSGYAATLDGLGLGFNRTAVWPFAEVGYIEGVYPPPSSVSAAATAPPPYNGWQLGAAESGGGNTGAAQVDGAAEGFAWPELAISMPGQGLK